METPASRPFPRRAALSLWLACWFAAAIVAWWQASGGSAAFDQAGLLLWRAGPALAPIGPVWLTQAMRALTQLGGGSVRVPLAILLLLWLLMRRRIREAAVLAALASLVPATNSLLKALFDRARPDLVPHLAGFSDASFPSGHSANGTAAYLGIALILASLAPRWRAAILGAALALSLGIALSRVWLGVHWPTDVIAGWLLGVGWVVLVWTVAMG